MNYRKCTGVVPITRGPIIGPVSDPDTTTDYYGNMDCQDFKISKFQNFKTRKFLETSPKTFSQKFQKN